MASGAGATFQLGVRSKVRSKSLRQVRPASSEASQRPRIRFISTVATKRATWSDSAAQRTVKLSSTTYAARVSDGSNRKRRGARPDGLYFATAVVVFGALVYQGELGASMSFGRGVVLSSSEDHRHEQNAGGHMTTGANLYNVPRRPSRRTTSTAITGTATRRSGATRLT